MIDLVRFRHQRIAVMGLARSGLAAARALLAGGAEVLAWDDGAGGRAAAEAAGIPLTDLHAADLDGVTALVLSPGIPHTFPAPHPVAARAKAAGIPIVGDVELLARADTGATFLGITGTNGKSTTTALCGHILRQAGRAIQVGGNLGTAVLTFDPVGADGTYVLEMSSYQLELTPSLGFDVAVLLNITPDHLDRHGGMDGYVAAKELIFGGDRQTRATPVAIVGIDDPHCAGIADRIDAAGTHRLLRISAERPVPGGVSAPKGVLVDDTDGTADPVLDLADCPALPGRHNWQNACAAYAAARALGVSRETAAAALKGFGGLAHRQQLVRTIGGIRFVNDSKATNGDAAAKALACYDAIYWILGGLPKDGGLAGLEPYMGRVRRAFLVGAATEAFAGWLGAQTVAHERCGTIDRAVQAAFAAAKSDRTAGATVLLSPACASFDQFPNFEVRGEAFAAAVLALGPEEVA